MNSKPPDEADGASATAWRTTQLAFPDERTRMEVRAPEGSDPAGGPVAEHALPVGTAIEGFRIVRPLGEGGFGIVYLAWDEALERHVAIKEYMPAQLATRAGATLEVVMRSERDRGTFEAGRRSFVNEARLLARFDHPALVKVLRFWEANGTAYMAMPYYEGPTLKAALERASAPPDEAQLRDWLRALLDALSAIHRENCFHRDIAPDNILLTESGPLLLDFGAARRVISDRTQVLTTMLKPGFAPLEQYGGEMLQGPWTDLYALAGVVHYAITGRPPVPSVVRVMTDSQPMLAATQAERYGAAFLRAIDAALAVRPEARPQDVQAFRDLLNEGLAADSALRLPTPKASPPPYQAEVQPSPQPAPSEQAPAASAPVAAVAPTLPDPVRTPAAAAATQQRTRRYGWAGVAAALCVVAVGGVLLWRPAAPVAPAPKAVTTVAPPSAPTTSAAPTQPVQPIAPGDTATLPATPAPAVVKPPSVAQPTPVPPRTTAKPARAAPEVPRTKPVVQESTAEAPARAAPSYSEPSRPPRCGELILKASLESLTPDELSFLKSRCR